MFVADRVGFWIGLVGREVGCELEDLSSLATGSGVVVAAVAEGLVVGGASGLLSDGCCEGARHQCHHVALRAGTAGVSAVSSTDDVDAFDLQLCDGDAVVAEDHAAV